MLCALIWHLIGEIYNLVASELSVVIFIYSLKIFVRNLLRESHRRNIFWYFVSLEMSDRGLTSNKSEICLEEVTTENFFRFVADVWPWPHV